jgi:hypothetical protein
MGFTNISDPATNGRQAGAILPAFMIFLPLADFSALLPPFSA